MLFPHFRSIGKTNEEVFFEHYARLLAWAVQITQGNRDEAEDLVHDLYLRVLRISRPIEKIDAADSYLFRILRNLHYSQLRRAGRDPINDLSIAEYDSIEHGLASTDRRQLLFVRSNLRQICLYACERKSTSCSASVLILRFFLGYYPYELMQILQAPRASVDQFLHVGRREARLRLERPDAIRCIARPETQTGVFSAGSEGTQRLFDELQSIIFAAVEGECFDPTAIEQRYAPKSESPNLTASELSHLVSCKMCLDAVNTVLGLPLLVDRSPEYGLDRDSTSGPGAGSGSAGRGPRKPSKQQPPINKLRRRAREVYEHRPEKLQIAVDGEVRTSQKVAAEMNELHLKLGRKEDPSFIEIFSEQGFCLAYLEVEDPACSEQLEQSEIVPFSDDRTLTVTVTFAADVPIIHVVYIDPVVAEEFATGSAAYRFVDDAESVAPHKEPEFVPHAPVANVTRYPVQWLRRMAGKAWKWVQARNKSFLSHMNPLLATAVVCAFAAILLFFLSFRASSVMKPEDLLRRSTMAENAPAQSGSTGVVVQAVRIQTPHRNLARTLYRDIQGRRRLKEQKLSREDAAIRAQLEGLGVLWNDPLSADSFRVWHDRAALERDVVKRSEKGLLTLTTTVAEGQIASESLTVRESDFHPVARTIELRDAETIEIAELNYSVLPWSSINPDLFEPKSDSLSSAIGPSIHPALLPRLPHTLSPAEIDSAELGARLTLNRMHLDTNDRIEVIRQSNGVHVEGVVESDAEKRQLQAQLYMVSHVSTNIITLREMEKRASEASAISSIQESSAATAPTPSALERYFSERGMDRIAAGAYVQEFIVSSFAVKRQSEQIAELLSRFASNSALSPSARASLSELLIQHKAALLSALEREDRQLVTLHLVPHSTSAAENGQENVGTLSGAAERNFALCAELTSDSSTSQTSAQEVAPKLADSIAQLRAIVLRISATDQSYSPSPASPQTANQNR